MTFVLFIFIIIFILCKMYFYWPTETIIKALDLRLILIRYA